MENVEKKITEEQLKKIKDHQLKMNNLLRDIGQVENQKHLFLHDYAGLIKENEDFKKELEGIYGAITIDLETGIYKPVEQPKKAEVVILIEML